MFIANRRPVGTDVGSELHTGEFGMFGLFRKFAKDQAGATAIEYALIASGICLAIVSALGQVGSSLSGIFVNVAAGFS